MRVALIGHGSMIHAVPYLKCMVEAGIDTHWLKIAPGDVEVPGVQVHRCHGRGSHGTPFGKLDYFVSGRRARKILKRIQPDVVNAHYASSGGLVAWLSGYRPYAVTIHGSDLLERSRTFLGRALLRRIFAAAGLVNPVCNHMVPALERLGVPRGRIMVMPFGIEIDRFPFRPPSPDPAGGLRIICTRSLRAPVYDIPTVIRALAEANSRGLDARLTLAAGGDQQRAFQALAAELGVERAVDFRGGYRPDELPGLLAEHDVYVSASLWDGASLSLMEAMACGIFPVVSDIPANHEWLEHGRDGLLFPTGDWLRLAGQLASLPGRWDFVRRAVEANRRTVEARADRAVNLRSFTERLAHISGGATSTLSHQ